MCLQPGMLSNLVAVASIGVCVFNKLPLVLASSVLVLGQKAPNETPLSFGVFQDDDIAVHRSFLVIYSYRRICISAPLFSITGQISGLVGAPIVVMKHMTKSDLERKGFTCLMLPHHCSSSKEVRTGTQTEQER